MKTAILSTRRRRVTARLKTELGTGSERSGAAAAAGGRRRRN